MKNLFLSLLLLLSLFVNLTNAQVSNVDNEHCTNEQMMQTSMNDEMQDCFTCFSSVFLQDSIAIFSNVILPTVIINHQKITHYNSLTLKVTTPPPTV